MADLEPVRYLVHDLVNTQDVICERCWTVVPEQCGGGHAAWHEALDAAQQGFTITMQGRTVEITEEFIAEALTNEGARRMARQLNQSELNPANSQRGDRVRELVATVAGLRKKLDYFERYVRPERDAMHNELRDILTLLGDAGAQERTYTLGTALERAGVIEELEAENKLLREERDLALAELEAVRNEDTS